MGVRICLNYLWQFGKRFALLWFENTARGGRRSRWRFVYFASEIVTRRVCRCTLLYLGGGCRENRHWTKKQRPSRRGVARALEPLEGGKGLIDIFIHEIGGRCKKKIKGGRDEQHYCRRLSTFKRRLPRRRAATLRPVIKLSQKPRAPMGAPQKLVNARVYPSGKEITQ